MQEEVFDVLVIGGGPVGGMTAWKIAKSGFRVAIIEEHERVGEPVQCAGLISPRCLEMAGIDTPVLNRLSGAEMFSPAGKMMAIGSREVRAVVIDRAAFDSALVAKALDSGASLFTGRRVKALTVKDGCRADLGDDMLRARIVIGADGARSATRKWLGLDEPMYRLTGFQADVTGLDIDQTRAKVFSGKQVAPNFFAWMIPAGDVTRVGLCVRECDETAHEHFKQLFRKGASAGYLAGGKVVRTYAGSIPLGTLPRTYSGSGMVVGDAAGQVKATSGGGIYPGLVCALRCAETAISALEKDDVSEKSLSAYHDAWSRDIGDELAKALMMYRVYASLDDSQLEDLFGMLNRPDILEIIDNAGDIDYPSRLGWMLLKREPGLLRYAGKFLRHGILNW